MSGKREHHRGRARGPDSRSRSTIPLTAYVCSCPAYVVVAETGRSAARLARLLREQEVPGSNPGAPIHLAKRPMHLSVWAFSWEQQNRHSLDGVPPLDSSSRTPSASSGSHSAL